MSVGTCKHGFALCQHGRCVLDCSSLTCESTVTLEHEYACDCAERACRRDPCRGDCGCRGCQRAYSDFLSSE